MMPIIEGPPGPNDPQQPLARRLVWFIALWIGGAASVAAAAYALRAAIMP